MNRRSGVTCWGYKIFISQYCVFLGLYSQIVDLYQRLISPLNAPVGKPDGHPRMMHTQVTDLNDLGRKRNVELRP
jgi:hypothetical protein